MSSAIRNFASMERLYILMSRVSQIVIYTTWLVSAWKTLKAFRVIAFGLTRWLTKNAYGTLSSISYLESTAPS